MAKRRATTSSCTSATVLTCSRVIEFRAMTKPYMRRVFFMIVRFYGLTSGSEQNPLGRIFGTCRGFMRYEEFFHHEMSKSMMYYKGETRVRSPASKDVTFSEAGCMQRLCMRQLGLCTDSSRAHYKRLVWCMVWEPTSAPTSSLMVPLRMACTSW